jgi:hypothetical protein
MLLKGSQLYYYSNTVFVTFVLCLSQYPVLIWGGGGWLEVLEPDKNATNGGKQRKLYNCPHYIVQHWKATRTLNSSYLYICRYSFAPIPISQSVEGTISVIPHPYAQTLFLHLYLWLLLRRCSVCLSETGQHMPLICVYRIHVFCSIDISVSYNNALILNK